MRNVVLRKAIADIRSRKLQSLLVFVIVAAAAGVGALAVTVTQSAADTYERVVEDAHGGHAWAFANNPAVFDGASSLPGLESASGPYLRVGATLTSTDITHPLLLWSMPGTMPEVAPTLIREGRWIDRAARNEAVIDRGLANKAHLRLGDTIEVTGNAGGGSGRLTIVGIGIHTTRPPYPLSDPADVFASPAAVEALQAGSTGQRPAYAEGFRLNDPSQADRLFAEATASAGVMIGGFTWQSIGATVGDANRASVILLRTFAVFAFFAVGFVLANTVSGQVLAQFRDIGLLRAVGLTPRQVTFLLLAEQLVIAAIAAVTGILIGVFSTPLLLHRVADLLGTSPVPVFDPAVVALVFGAVVGEVLVFTLIPAWRGGRLSTVNALTTGPMRAGRRSSSLAKVAARFNLPAIVSLGLKDAFARPSRSWLSIAALVFAAATLASSLTVEATGQAIADDPSRIGRPPYQLELTSAAAPGAAGATPEAEVVATAQNLPQSEGMIPISYIFGTLDGRNYFPTHATGAAVGEMPYRVLSGRMFASPGEAVIGLGLQNKSHVALGETITVKFSGGAGLPLRVVGVVAAEDNAGRLVIYSRDELKALDPSSYRVDHNSVGVRLRAGADPAGAVRAARDSSGGRIAVDDSEAKFRDDLATQRSDMRSVTLPLNLSLVLIAAINLISTLTFSIRERVPEFGILKAIGYTPRQIYGSVVVTSSLFASVAVAAGAPLGYFVTVALVDHFGGDSGWPAGVAAAPPLLWMSLALPVVAAFVVVASALPARLAAGLRVSEALRFE